MSLVIGIDIGTYEAKGVAVNADGRVVASATRTHRMRVPVPGWAEHDAELDWWDGFVAIVRELLADEAVDTNEIAGVGCSAIGPCVLPIDAQGSPLRPAILYGVDTRATDQIAAIEARLGNDEILRRSGNHLSTQSAGPKIAWIADNEPDIYAKAHRFVTSQSFLVGRLTGRWVMDHGTAGYYHPFYNLGRNAWDPSGLEDLVDVDRLPELAWSNEIAGEVSREAAEVTGLAEGTPVIVGTTDAPAEAVASGITEPGRLMLMYGSTIFTIEMLDRPIQSTILWSAPYVFPGSYVLAGGTATAGTLTRWLLDLVPPTMQDSGELFTQFVEEAASSPPGARGLTMLPYFSGERTPINDPAARGMIFGLTLSHERGDIYRACLEGIAQGIRANLDYYAELGAEPSLIRSIGGGVKNPVWLSAVSDASGYAQQVVSGTGASLGDAALAALAVGMISDRSEIDRWVTVERTVEPDERLAAVYAEQQQRYDGLYDATKHIMHATTASQLKQAH